jgi:hypothetical protein
MKTADDMKGSILLAAELCMNDSAYTQLVADIEAKCIRIPTVGVIANAKIKLDIMAMHWLREVYRTHDVAADDTIDSSPQMGWNFLVVRTDEFLYPLGTTALGRLQIDLGRIYQRRTLTITCLGYGKAGLVQKLENYVHCGCLETQDLERCS